ncbi:MAG: hypothetical protein JWM93_1002 [Frankiales bacterium]|nr:hypothetical protein [Frankiales bacterium]
MLFALGEPLSLVGLILGFLGGVVAVGLVQARLSGRKSATSYGGASAVGRHVDPFGGVAAALGGVGWASPPEVGRFRRGPARSRAVMTLLAAPATHAVLAAAGFAALAAMGRLGDLGLVDTRLVLQGYYPFSFLDLTVVGFTIANLTMALLHVVPLPPMAAGRILLLLAPQTPSWQRASYQLEDNNWGIGIMLALSLPIFSGFAVSASLTGALARPILRAVSGVG